MISRWQLLLLITCLVGSQGISAAEPWPFHRSCSSQERQILKQLDSLTTFHFDDVLLSDVLEQISSDHGFKIMLDQEATGKSVDAETTVTLDVNKTALRSSLALMLKPLGLTYVVRNDVLLVTTPANATDLRVYSIQRLVDAGIDCDSIAKIVSQLGLANPLFPPAPRTAARLTTTAQPKQRVTLARSAGSDAKFMVVNGDLLVVRATDQQHVELANAIQSLWSAFQANNGSPGDDEFHRQSAEGELARKRNSLNALDRVAASETPDPFGDDGADPFGEADDPFGEADPFAASNDPFGDHGEHDPFGDVQGEESANQHDPFSD